MKKITAPLLLTVFIALAIQSCKRNNPAATATVPDVIPVKTMPLTKTSQQDVREVSGQLTTDDETYLSFKTTGIIQHVAVREGDAIKKGQLLATLDLTEITAQLGQSKLALEKAQRDFNRLSRLFADSVATLEQFQNGQTTLSVAQHQLDAVSFNKIFSEIRAPRDGFVLRKFANEGQVITSGTPVLLTNGAASGHWILRCGVSDREWTSLQLKDPAIIHIDALRGTPVSGIILRKSEGADASSGTFTIDIAVNPTSGAALATGMFGKATIYPVSAQSAWTIPYDALLDGDAGRGYVFITNDNKTARKVSVELGAIARDRIEILAGLENATSLIISGNAYLKDSTAIHVIQ